MPIELLNEIFLVVRLSNMLSGLADHVKLCDNDLFNLLPVAMVSRYLYNITMPLIYQSIQIDISGYSNSSSYTEDHLPTKRYIDPLVTRLSVSPSTRAMVRKIRVFSKDGVHPNTLKLLLSWLPKCSQLQSFSWDVHGLFPSTLLEQLAQQCPRLHLQMRTGLSKSSVKKDWKFLMIAPSILCSLQICMPKDLSGDEDEADLAKKELFWVLRNCPSLQSLSTYSYSNRKHKSHTNRRGPPLPLGSWRDEKPECPLPQLLELSITDSTFEADDLWTWGAHNGWAKLKKITLWDEGLLNSFFGCEHSLRSINLIDANLGYEDPLGRICLRTTELRELKLRTDVFRLPFSVLETCGSSLRTLAVHPHPNSVPLRFLLAVQRFCPRVTNLATNLGKPYKSLVSFPALGFELALTKQCHRSTSPSLAKCLS